MFVDVVAFYEEVYKDFPRSPHFLVILVNQKEKFSGFECQGPQRNVLGFWVPGNPEKLWLCSGGIRAISSSV